MSRPGQGLLIYAAVILAVLGALNVIWGSAALANSHVFVVGAHYVIWSLKTWGWIHLIIGIIEFVTAAGVMTANQAARWFGVFLVAVNALGHMFAVEAHPFWALVIIALDVVALYSLCAYGGRPVEAA